MAQRKTPFVDGNAATTSLAGILSTGSRAAICSWFEARQPIDAAAEAAELEDGDLAILVDLLPSSQLAAMMGGADDALRLRIATYLDDRQLLPVLDRMQNDDVADVLGLLEHQRTGRLLGGMREADRALLTQLLQYPDDTAGSIMTTSYLSLREDRTVADCLAMLRAKGQRTEQIQTMYVLSASGMLRGFVDLRRILSSPRSLPVSSIMETRMISVDPYADQEEAAELVAKYDLNALPVVSGGQLLGVITVDDIIDVIIEEYSEDMLRLAGANEEERLDSPLADTVRMRLPWLLVNLVTAFLASWVVKLFEGTIEQVVALSAIMTVVSGMGGNAGSQTMAIMVRHLSKQDVNGREARCGVGKEIAAGVIDGAVNGLVTGAVVFFMYQNPVLSLVAFAAMVGNMVIAGIFGFLVPVVLKALKQDPAVSSSIFLTTATDMLGFLLFLGLAQLLLPMLL